MADHGSIDHAGITGVGIPATTVNAKGDILAATANDTVTRLGVGTDGQVLTAASGQSTGLQWATPSSGISADLLPWTIDRIPAFGSIANTNWSTFVAASGSSGDVYLNAIMQSSGAQNAEIAWDEVLSAGTWTFAMRHYTEANRGIYSLQFDGTDVGTIDGYAGTPGVVHQLSSITGIVVAATAKIRVSLQMATKNASSSSYYGAISGYQLRRTA